jgi:hypothetical protein
MIIKLNICVSKVNKERIYTSPQTGQKYLSLVLMDTKQPDAYDNDGFAQISLSKEERESGIRGEIVGNWKYLIRPTGEKALSRAEKAPSSPSTPKDVSDSQSEIPF